MSKTVRKCPVCSLEDAQKLTDINLDLPEEYRLPNHYRVVSCTHCGTCFADTQASLEDYDHYYSNCNVYGYTDSSSSDANTLDYMVLRTIEENISSKEARILDMGCGDGHLLLDLQKKDYHFLMGIDPSSQSIKNLEEKEIRGRVGNVYSSPEKDLENTFDLCCIISVVEHLLEPKRALQNLAKYLKEKGRMLIVVPDYGNLHRETTPLPDHFNQEHINYFSSISLENLMGLLGFEKEKLCETDFLFHGKRMFALIAVFKRSNKQITSSLLREDEITSASISTYLNKQEFEFERYRSLIKNQIVEQKKKIYIWGVGSFAMTLFYYKVFEGCEVIAFIDNNASKQGKLFCNKPVLEPLQIEDKKAVIVITVMLYAEEIVKQMSSLNLENEVFLFD